MLDPGSQPVAAERTPLTDEGQTQFLRTLFAHAPGFMAVLHGPEHVFAAANASYLELIGPREVLGRPAREALPEVRGQGYFTELDQVYRTGRPYTATARCLLLERRSGGGLEERYVSLVYEPLYGKADTIVGVCVHGCDVTELILARRALGDAARRQDEFIAVLAHELRNPLAPMRQAAQIAITAGVTDAQLRWSGQVIHRQTRHMALLLDDLLDVSRITRGKLSLRLVAVEIAAIFDSAIEMARPLVDARHHELCVHLPENLPPLEADALRLAQVLANLLTNAAKYTARGGSIELVAGRDQDELVISVSDTGIGIAPTRLTAIFETFSQLNAPIERSESGLGIGLALVKGLVRLHGGTVSAHSAGLGKGSTFTVRLPMTAIAPCDEVHPHPRATKTAALKVLIVDDNHDAAESLGTLLSFDGHEIRCALDGREGLGVAQEFRPDVVLLDIGLPALNGYEVAARLRSSDWGRALTLVAITGWGQDADKRRARAAGFDSHLTKPVDIDEVRAMLAALPRRLRQ